MAKVIIYLRVSTDQQETANQKFEIEGFCKRKELHISEIIEEVMSGTKDIKDRKIGPVLAKMERGDTLIVTEISRLSRSLFHVFEILQSCLDRGIHIMTVKEGYVLGNDIQSKVMAFAFGMAAEIERNMISQRTKEALERKKAEGVILGRPRGRKSSSYKLDEKSEQIQGLLNNKISVSAIGRIVGAHRLTVSAFIKSNHMN